MNLKAYLTQKKLTVPQFQKQLERRGLECSAKGIYKWLYGERTPRLDALVAIEAATGGKVTPADFKRQADAAA